MALSIAGEREREREREREGSGMFSKRYVCLLTWFTHVHWLNVSLQHTEERFLVRRELVKFVLCHCKTERKSRKCNQLSVML